MILEEYGQFLVNESLMSRYVDRPPQDMMWTKFKTPWQPQIKAKKNSLHKESEDRYKLDAVVNFFQLLATT